MKLLPKAMKIEEAKHGNGMEESQINASILTFHLMVLNALNYA